MRREAPDFEESEEIDAADSYFEHIIKEKVEAKRRVGSKVVDYINRRSLYNRVVGGLLGTGAGVLFLSQSGDDSYIFTLIGAVAGYFIGSWINEKRGRRKVYNGAVKKFPGKWRDIAKLEDIANGHYIG